MSETLRRWLRRRWHLLGALLVLVYFGYHGLHGDRGLLAWVDKTRELEAARTQLAAVQAQIDDYATKVEALQPDRSDPDLLEEQLRHLGYLGEGEVIVLPQTELPPPTEAGAVRVPARLPRPHMFR